MAVLSYGKPLIEIAELDADDNMSPWVAVDVPKDGTTSMETQEGDNTEYLEEGGGLVDSYRKASRYSLTFDLYAKKGFHKPIEDVNGVITKNYAIRLTPEDPETYGFIMRKCSVSCVETHTVADGMIWRYTFNGLVAKGRVEIMDMFVGASNLDADVNYVVFSAAADTTGQTVTAKVGAGGSVTVSAADNWCTVTAEGGAITVKVTENTGEKRTTTVTMTSGAKTGQFTVIQSAVATA